MRNKSCFFMMGCVWYLSWTVISKVDDKRRRRRNELGPRRSSSFRKPNGYGANGNGSVTPSPRRNTVGSATPELQTPRSYSGRQNGYFKEMRRLSTAPLNFVAIPKEDTMSFSSVFGSEPESPPLS
ncbi:hypothetical protein ACJIZ3_019515 [Penstemon smallii]|uniref:Uncharacterized protein n=1 Tax=Penstemon smallii TaxID=265156 RepID=A0ABD3T2M2_9LAMI